MLRKISKAGVETEAVHFLLSGVEIDPSRTCQFVGLWLSRFYHQSQAKGQTALRLRILKVAANQIRVTGDHVILVWEGRNVNHVGSATVPERRSGTAATDPP